MSVSQVEFSVRPLNKKAQYYGFSLDKTPLYKVANNVTFHNSGKSVTEQSIVGHVSRFSDNFQLVGVDCKRM